MAKFTATQSAVISCNVSYKTQIDGPTLVGLLKGEIPLEGWYLQLDTFFHDVPSELVKRTASENGIPLEQLEAINAQLPPGYQNKRIKELLYG